MKYIKVNWPEIQDYMLYGQMNVVDSDSYIHYDPNKNCWFVPEDWIPSPYEQTEEPDPGTIEYFELHDCYDAIGGDWEG